MRQLVAGLSLLICGFHAHAGTVSLGGLSIEPSVGLTVISFDNTDPAAVSSLTFDFTYLSIAPSWTEELTVQITHEPTGAAVQLGAFAPAFSVGTDYCVDVFGSTCDFDFGGTASPDALFVTNLVVPFALDSGLGMWTIELGEGFDDAPNPDGRFDDGSVMEINTTVVPVPAAGWLLLSALAGLARLRRRA